MFLTRIGNFLHYLVKKLPFFKKSHRKDTLLDTVKLSLFGLKLNFPEFFFSLTSRISRGNYTNMPQSPVRRLPLTELTKCYNGRRAVLPVAN